ncbi:MAG TPA: lipoate--protein ligase family protein [Aldersonia sp.]
MSTVRLVDRCFPEDPALDAALATALLRRASRDPGTDRVVRIYSPAPTVAFGRLDANRPQFGEVAATTRQHGFAPVVRGTGGRAAAYHEQTVVLEIIAPDDEGPAGVKPRFGRFAGDLVEVLQALGVDARIGPVPGEYCPGDWTVNGAGRVKLAGTAQRVMARAWMIGAELVVTNADPIRAVLADVYAALELDFDPATAASVADLQPDVTVDSVRSALVAHFGVTDALVVDDELVSEARTLRHRHEVAQ